MGGSIGQSACLRCGHDTLPFFWLLHEGSTNHRPESGGGVVLNGRDKPSKCAASCSSTLRSATSSAHMQQRRQLLHAHRPPPRPIPAHSTGSHLHIALHRIGRQRNTRPIIMLASLHRETSHVPLHAIDRHTTCINPEAYKSCPQVA